MKTLNIIQTLSKIGKILSKIVYICCIAGICGCVLGTVAMLAGAEVIKLNGMTLHSFLKTEAGVNTGTIWLSIVGGLMLCIGEFFVSRMAYVYFENELKAGTPFTSDGAKELLHLGISIIWIPIASSVLSQVAQSVITQFMQDAEKLNSGVGDNVTIGVMFIVMSLLCRCGAECCEKKENDLQ